MVVAKVLLFPSQIILAPIMVVDGLAVMVSVFDTEAEQPLIFVTVTVYAPAILRFSDAVETPVLHEKPEPLLAVHRVEEPLHIVAAPTMVADGLALTVRVLLPVKVQPSWEVTITAYVPAVSISIDAFVAPVLHRYVPPPVEVKVLFPPSQITLAPVIVADGLVVILSVFVAVSEQPLAFVIVTVYVPAVLRFIAAVEAPVLHEKIEPPLAVHDVDRPLHISDAPIMVAVGLPVNKMVLVPEELHPSP